MLICNDCINSVNGTDSAYCPDRCDCTGRTSFDGPVDPAFSGPPCPLPAVPQSLPVSAGSLTDSVHCEREPAA